MQTGNPSFVTRRVLVVIRVWLFNFGGNAAAIGEYARRHHPVANTPVSDPLSRRAALDNTMTAS